MARQLIPGPFWVKVLIFLVVMFLIGAVGQYIKIRAQRQLALLSDDSRKQHRPGQIFSDTATK